jgi:CRP/FNR family cyclic AMP-dependent transcriptional regulator
MKDRSHEILPKALLDEIAKAATVRTFPKHAVIVTESDATDNIYVMLAGKARVYVSDEKGREVVLNQLGPGEYFGEITIDGGPRSASVMALEECRCALIRGTELTAFIEHSPGFALHVAKKLAHRVRELTDNVRSLALMDVYGRVARLLLELAETKDGQLVITEPLTHKEIASRVGASRKEEGRLVIARKPPPRW